MIFRIVLRKTIFKLFAPPLFDIFKSGKNMNIAAKDSFLEKIMFLGWRL
jgi:hypothetical protein